MLGRAEDAVCTSAIRTATVRLNGTCTFTKTGIRNLELPAGLGAIGTPIFNQYPDSSEILTRRSHGHL